MVKKSTSVSKSKGAVAGDGDAAFLSFLKKKDKVVKKTANETAGSGYATGEEAWEALGFTKEGQTKTLKCQLVGIYRGKSKKGAMFVSFGYVVKSDLGKGLMISRYVDFTERTMGKRDYTEDDALKDCIFELQRMGYDTEGMDASELDDLMKQAVEEKPGVMVTVKGYKSKSGENKGAKGINVSASRPWDMEEDEEEEEDDNEEEVEDEEGEDEEEEEEEPAPKKGKASSKSTKKKKEEEEEEEEEESDDSEEEEEEEDGEFDEKDPSTWVGYKCKAKPKGTTKQAVYEIVDCARKGNILTIKGKDKKSHKIKHTEVIDFVDD